MRRHPFSGYRKGAENKSADRHAAMRFGRRICTVTRGRNQRILPPKATVERTRYANATLHLFLSAFAPCLPALNASISFSFRLVTGTPAFLPAEAKWVKRNMKGEDATLATPAGAGCEIVAGRPCCQLECTPSWTSSSSGASSWESGRSPPRTGTPSPPAGLAAADARTFWRMSPTQDEGVDFAENFGSSGESGCAKRKRVLYKCMWKECGERFSTCKDVERHVRVKHLGRGDESEDSASSDHEEEFYYTESEEDDDLESDSGSTLLGEHGECTHNVYTSAPTLSHLDMARPPHEDPQYQMLARSAVPASPPNLSSASPINIPTVQRSFSWQPHASAPTAMVSPQKFMRLSPKTLSASPKSSPLHRRVRSESRKCRKVHGMENKDMWCTQCKWKKACSRYVD
ncbi:hypothetical protein HPB51_019560 [Rhipicephalus microplus]|uniref:C2H2-type domain-containing protein n=1 Tax=Rhipicephalus microplus TaxID=6941 RepID=A0A9J6DWS2_RHIMP|nr:hypothetical protein HPB51_019560 [Rhipicephalus microplus]